MSARAAERASLQPDAEAEDAFLELKEQLNALDYNFPLGIESASLARRLLDDLILTTENYELLRQDKERLEKETKHGHAANKLRPLQTENARLVRENNEVCPPRLRGCTRLLTGSGLCSCTRSLFAEVMLWMQIPSSELLKQNG